MKIMNNEIKQLCEVSEEITLSIEEKTEEIDYSVEWERAHAYNTALFEKNDPDAFRKAEKAESPDEEYLSCLNLTGDGMMGYIEIPKIDVKLSLYHTTDENVLEKYGRDIVEDAKKGKIEIEYYSDDELARIIQIINANN